jgi:GT2 family glycosyltransferase
MYSNTLAKIIKKIEYIFNNANIGYGSAHNIAMRKSIDDGVNYHLVLNPDIYFESGVLEKLFEYMEFNQDVGHVMPKVVYPNGELQYLTKMIPTPADLIFRRFIPFKNWKEKKAYKYELRFSGYDKIINVPYLSGCFMFLRVKVLEEIGVFDERFFMYPEDIDLTRRIHEKYKTIFYPEVSIVHEHEKASFKSFKMMKIHMWNMIKYFNKWGWFFDKNRTDINKKLLEELI